MRTDTEFVPESRVDSEKWGGDEVDLRLIIGDEMREGELAVHSLSGRERNHFFLNCDRGQDFADVSAISGMDSEADARTFALLDYDRDGWLDVVSVNGNHPLAQLFHNDMSRIIPENAAGMIAIQFVGGNRTASSSEWSNRDGYGARVELHRDGEVIVREHRCGEGFAAQNSSTMILGLGAWKEVDKVAVHWPSGRTSITEAVPEGTLLRAHEDREEEPFERSAYRRDRTPATQAKTLERFPLRPPEGGQGQVYTTMATWCASCIGHLADLRHLSENGIAVIAVPVDDTDNAVKLQEYGKKWDPPYSLADISPVERAAVRTFFAGSQGSEAPALPSSAIVDREGNVLRSMRGIPTLSQVRKWLPAGLPSIPAGAK